MKTPLATLAAWMMLVAASPDAKGVEALGWMSGVWVEEKDGRWTEERWAPPRGGVMLGTSLSGRGEQAGDHEFVRLARDSEGRVTYFVSPRGAPPVPFRLTSMSAGAAVFENPGNDYPTRISYRLAGETLVATIAGPDGANSRTWSYTRAR